MAAMTTVLTRTVSNTANAVVYTYTGNTFSKPRKFIQKSKPSVNGASAEDRITVISGTVDPAGNILAPVVSFEVAVRRPPNGASADLTAALAAFRDCIASTNFDDVVNYQKPLA